MNTDPVVDVIKQLATEKDKIVCVYLLGARALGYYTPKSRVDIAVIFSATFPGDAYWFRLGLEKQLAMLLHPLPVSVADFERAPLPVVNETLKYGLLIYDGCPERRIEVERARRKEYINFLPRFNQYRTDIFGIELE